MDLLLPFWAETVILQLVLIQVAAYAFPLPAPVYLLLNRPLVAFLMTECSPSHKISTTSEYLLELLIY